MPTIFVYKTFAEINLYGTKLCREELQRSDNAERSQVSQIEYQHRLACLQNRDFFFSHKKVLLQNLLSFSSYVG